MSCIKFRKLFTIKTFISCKNYKTLVVADVGRFKCTPIYQRSHWSSMQPCSCHICNKTFSNSFNMKQHIQNVHLPAQMVKCQICRKSFKNKRYLRKHLVTFHGAPLRRIHTQDGQIIHIRERYNSPIF